MTLAEIDAKFKIDLSKPIQRSMKFGAWVVDEKGNITESTRPYEIESNQLMEADWILHMSKKAWCNLGDFVNAYLTACDIAGIKTLNIRVAYDE